MRIFFLIHKWNKFKRICLRGSPVDRLYICALSLDEIFKRLNHFEILESIHNFVFHAHQFQLPVLMIGEGIRRL